MTETKLFALADALPGCGLNKYHFCAAVNEAQRQAGVEPTKFKIILAVVGPYTRHFLVRNPEVKLAAAQRTVAARIAPYLLRGQAVINRLEYTIETKMLATVNKYPIGTEMPADHEFFEDLYGLKELGWKEILITIITE